jgi:hypothetical protein
MSGAPAQGSKYATLNHLIVIPRTQPELPDHARQRAYRMAQLKIAVHLARAALDATPVRTQTFDTAESSDQNHSF